MLSYKNDPIVEEKIIVPPRLTINMRKMLKFSRLGKDIITLKKDNLEEELEEYTPADGIITNKNYLDTMEGKKLPVKHCIKGTKGHDIKEEILRGHDLIIEKLTFGSKELIEYLKTREFDEVELVGLCTDICVVSNALLVKAYYPEMKVSVDSSCCAGVTPLSHNEALNTMRMCQIDVK